MSFRGFITSTSAGITTASYGIQLNNTITGIESRDASTLDNDADDHIFTISGTHVGTDFSALQSGVYIVNGKKIVK